VALNIAIKVCIEERQNRSKFSEEDARFQVRDKPASVSPGQVIEVVHPFMGFFVLPGGFIHPIEPWTES
jgi:hypothetical protein